MLPIVLILISQSLFAGGDRMEMIIETGCGFYTGSFLEHLKADRALLITPTIDCYMAACMTPALGLHFHTGTGSVIHLESEPMEGIILYQSIGPFLRWTHGRYRVAGWVDTGFQMPDMSLEWYGSIDKNDNLTSLNLSLGWTTRW